MAGFKYCPLDEGTHEIRLLKLFESPNDKSDIHGELIHVSYQSDNQSPGSPLYSSTNDGIKLGWGPFGALSYVWGSPHWSTRKIYLSGYEFHVTLNLHNALTRIRRLISKDKTFPCHVWVDAICIDQSNIEEKNKQIPRMRYIYSEAKVVVCSLPPEWSMGEDGGMTARTMNWDAGVNALQLLAEIQKSGQREMFSDHLQRGVLKYDPARWAAMFDFFANPYWTRLWIIQEIALAPNQVLILAGKNAVPWDTVAKAAMLFRDLPYNVRNQIIRSVSAFPRGTVPHSPNMDKIVSIDHQLSRCHDQDSYAEPNWIVRMTRTSEAKNVRDKVYGLLSLMDPAIVDRIDVDYGKTAAAVWTDFATAVIKESASLEILPNCAQPDHNKARNAPYWVPDLGFGAAAPPIRQVSKGSVLLNHETKARIDGGILTVCGIHLDAIDGVTGVWGQFDDTVMNRDTERGMVQSRGQGTPLDPSRMLESLRRTLLSAADVELEGIHKAELPTLYWLRNNSHSHSARRILSFFERNSGFLLPGNYRLVDVMEPSHTLETRNVEAAMSHYLDRKNFNVVEQMDVVLISRRLATTTQGRLALVPCDTRPGDCIFALYGHDGCGVLRKNGDKWRWVGNCYVDGLMDREEFRGGQGEFQELQIT